MRVQTLITYKDVIINWSDLVTTLLLTPSILRLLQPTLTLTFDIIINSVVLFLMMLPIFLGVGAFNNLFHDNIPSAVFWGEYAVMGLCFIALMWFMDRFTNIFGTVGKWISDFATVPAVVLLLLTRLFAAGMSITELTTP